MSNMHHTARATGPQSRDRTMQAANVTTQQDWRLRLVDESDIDVIGSHRERVFLEAGRAPALVEQMRAPFRAWLQRQLEWGLYIGWFAERDGRVAGGVGVMEIDWPPHTHHPGQARRGYVLNVFVEHEFRGRGCATVLMLAAEAEMRQRGIEYATLHSTDSGRPLYDAMGWSATNEMAKRVGQA